MMAIQNVAMKPRHIMTKPHNIMTKPHNKTKLQDQKNKEYITKLWLFIQPSLIVNKRPHARGV